MNQTDIPAHFKTNNAALVAAAKVVGIPWVQGLPCIVHHYTRAILTKLGFGRMEEAIAARRRGAPEYVLADTPELQRFLTAWDAAKKEIAEKGEAAVMHLEICTIEDAATIMAFYADKKKDILSLVWEVPGTMTEEYGGEAKERTLPNGGRKVTAPGFRQYTSNLNEADKRRLKVD